MGVCMEYGARNGINQQFNRHSALIIGGDVIVALIIPRGSEAVVFLSF